MRPEDHPADGPLDQSLLALEKMQLESFGRTPCDLIASAVEEAREDLIAAMARADKFDEAGAHMRIAGIVEQLDNLRIYLSERGVR